MFDLSLLVVFVVLFGFFLSLLPFTGLKPFYLLQSGYLHGNAPVGTVIALIRYPNKNILIFFGR